MNVLLMPNSFTIKGKCNVEVFDHPGHARCLVVVNLGRMDLCFIP